MNPQKFLLLSPEPITENRALKSPAREEDCPWSIIGSFVVQRFSHVSLKYFHDTEMSKGDHRGIENALSTEMKEFEESVDFCQKMTVSAPRICVLQMLFKS